MLSSNMFPQLVTFLSLSALTSSFPSPSHKPLRKPAAFFLAGDSTTAPLSSGGGGWGDGFLSTLINGAWGINYGHDGATTVSFVAGGDWARVLSSVSSSKGAYDPYVTIQFGHNDQKAAANISVPEFTTNLENMVSDVRAAGGTPILVTSLSRRNFNSTTGKVILDLAPQVNATLAAAKEVRSAYIDLNKYSMAYLNAIGETDALLYDRIPGDNTHLNVGGDFLFGNMVGWLIDGSEVGKDVKEYTCLNQTIIRDIEEGVFILPVNTTAS